MSTGDVGFSGVTDHPASPNRAPNRLCRVPEDLRVGFAYPNSFGDDDRIHIRSQTERGDLASLLRHGAVGDDCQAPARLPSAIKGCGHLGIESHPIDEPGSQRAQQLVLVVLTQTEPLLHSCGDSLARSESVIVDLDQPFGICPLSADSPDKVVCELSERRRAVNQSVVQVDEERRHDREGIGV